MPGTNFGELAPAAAVCSLALVPAAVPLADFAQRGAATAGAQYCYFVWGAIARAAAVSAVYGRGSLAGWAITALATLVAAVRFTWYRRRVMVTAAPAYPAGRDKGDVVTATSSTTACSAIGRSRTPANEMPKLTPGSVLEACCAPS
jgi:hypothetical protein